MSDARPGDLTTGWRAVLAVAWLGVFFAYAAVWQASVQLGLATWWVGPRSTPTPALVRAIPFFVAIVGLVLVVYNVRRLSWITFGLAAASLLIALPDFSTSVAVGLLEAMISVAMMIVAAASLTGRYRLAEGPSDPRPTASQSVPGTDRDAAGHRDAATWSAPSTPTTGR